MLRKFNKIILSYIFLAKNRTIISPYLFVANEDLAVEKILRLFLAENKTATPISSIQSF